jgi:hypothetical protein
MATQAFFIADRDYELVDASMIYSIAGSDATPPTLDVTIDKGTTAPGGGTAVDTAGLSLHATANTTYVWVQDTRRKRWLAKGDRLSLKFTGTLTALVGTVATVSLSPR